MAVEAPETNQNVQYVLSFYFPSEFEPDIDDLKEIVRSVDKQHPWDAGTDDDGVKRESISAIEYEDHTKETTIIGHGLMRVHCLVVTAGDSPMTTWDRVFEFNDYVNEHNEYIQRCEDWPSEMLQVKYGIWFREVQTSLWQIDLWQ
jgi:hypothetical protein